MRYPLLVEIPICPPVPYQGRRLALISAGILLGREVCCGCRKAAWEGSGGSKGERFFMSPKAPDLALRVAQISAYGVDQVSGINKVIEVLASELADEGVEFTV